MKKGEIQLVSVDHLKNKPGSQWTREEYFSFLCHKKLTCDLFKLGSKYIDIKNFGYVPFYAADLFLLEKEKKMEELPLEEYAKGYTEGLKEEFIPHIDSAENRKGLIVDTLTDFVIGPPIVDDKSFFEYGLRVGRRQKAWEIVFKMRFAFDDFFKKHYPELINYRSSKKPHFHGYSITNEWSITNSAEQQKEETDNKELALPELRFEDVSAVFHYAGFQGFIEVEKKLFARGIIDNKRNWKNDAQEVVALFNQLLNKKYLKRFPELIEEKNKNKEYHKQSKRRNNIYRDFFHQWFNVDVTKYFEPSSQKRIAAKKIYSDEYASIVSVLLSTS